MTEDAARISLDAPRTFAADDCARLGDCLNGLGTIMALPAVWTGAEPSQIINTLLDALIGMLRLSFVYVRLRDTEGGAAADLMRVADLVGDKDGARVIDEGIDSPQPRLLSRAAVSVGELDVAIASARLGLGGEFGLVVAGSQRYDFPTQTEKLLLDVAANQATIGLQQVYLAEQRRVTTELDQRVAQRTRDFAIAKEALRESERESRLVVDSIPGLIAAFTPSGQLEFVNRPICEYFGKTLDELKSWDTGSTTHPEDHPRVVEVFTQSIASAEPFEIELRARRFDGVYRWFQSRSLPLRDVNGNIVRWYNLLTDIDERKRAEEALRESERESRIIVDSIPGLVAILAPSGDLDAVNDRVIEYCGRPLQEMKHWAVNDTLHPEDRSRTIQLFAALITSGLPSEWEARIRRFDGVYRWFQLRGLPLRDANGRIARWYVLLTDIDDLKRTERELRRAYDHLTEAQRLSQTGSFTADLERDEHYWSDEFYRICEFEPGSRVTIQRLGEIVHPEDAALYEGAIGRAMAGTDPDFYFRVVTSRGVVKYLRGFAHRIADRPVFVGAVQDVTASKMAQEALNRAGAELAHVSRMTSLSALTASIAHEVNQPLSGIITNAETCLRMLDAAPPDIDGAHETARRTIRDGNRASDVITRLRALFSKREFTLEPVDLNEATREVIALSANDLQRNRVILQPDLAEGLSIVTGDRIQLQQVILNLLRNASDAMVDVHDRPRHLLIKTEAEGGTRVRLTVRDVGGGLTPVGLDSLFDAFYTTKSGGMGIGLFVSRSIIERHQGRLWAEANDGPGATFAFSVPAVHPA